MTLVYYAPGGGTGHFNRAYAVGRELRRSHQLNPVLITTSAFVPAALDSQLAVLRLPSTHDCQQSGLDFKKLAHELLISLAPDVLAVDTFPQGLMGELNLLPLKPAQKVLVARSPELLPPETQQNYSQVLIPQPDQLGYILNRSPHELLPRAQAQALLRVSPDHPVIVCAHNGSPAETHALFKQVAYSLAGQPYQLRLASLHPPRISQLAALAISHYPLSELFHGIDLLMGGGGYNLVSEARCLGKRVLLRALERPIDRQLERLQEGETFSADSSPEQLALQVAHALAQPSPQPHPEWQGAARVAACLANLYREFSVQG